MDNTIKELQEQIKKLTLKIRQLRAEKKALKAKLTRPRAKIKDKFYYMGLYGDVFETVDLRNPLDDELYKVGNYSLTREGIIKHYENRITKQRLKDIALKLNKGQVIDFQDDTQRKYYICFDWEFEKFVTHYAFIVQEPNVVYCLDENFLNVAIEDIGRCRLKQLLME